MTPSTSWPANSGAPPIYATTRNTSRRSDGAQVGVIARHLGTPLIPWQQHVADVATERRPDGSYEHQVIVVSVPRQTGKTTLLRAIGTHSCLVCGRDVFYTAQTGKDARERWLDLVKTLRVNDALADRVNIGLRGGSEQVVFLDTGAAFRVFAPTPESLHGYTPPKVMIDEAFAQTGMSGELLMGAIGPAQITIRDRQIWIVSTAGTAESTFLHDWIDRGVEGTPRVAAFVWGAREDQNPYDLDDIAAFHPGVGFPLNGKVLDAVDVLEQADRNSKAEYERAYANRRTVTTSNLIPVDAWRALAGRFDPPADLAQVTLAFDVDDSRQSGAIVASWIDGDRRRIQVVERRPGLRWMTQAVVDLDNSWRPRRLVAGGNGPVLEVVDEVVRRGVVVDVLSEREFSTASSAFLTYIEDELLEHRGEPGDVLESSVTGLVTRNSGDGVAFSRRHSIGDSSPGIAAAVAAWSAGRVSVDRGIELHLGDIPA